MYPYKEYCKKQYAIVILEASFITNQGDAMLDTYVRPYLQPVFNLISSLFIALRLNALAVTFLAFVTGIIAAVFLSRGQVLLACALMWTSGLLDCIDGTIARLERTSTNWGAYNDLLSDRMVEAAIIAGFAFWQPTLMPVCFAFIVAVLFHFSTFVVAGTLFKNRGRKSMHYEPSFIERGEAFTVFTLMMFIPTQSFNLLFGLTGLIALTAMGRYIRIARFVHSE